MLYQAFGPLAVPTIICIVAGVILLIIELLIPGFGAPGIMGLILLGSALLLQIFFGSAAAALWIIAGVGVILLVAVLIILRSFKSGRLSKSPLVLNDAIGEESGTTDALRMALVGESGTAVTALRPAGIADFSGHRLDVVTEGSFLEAGTPVTVLSVDGTRIVVQRKED